MKKVRGVFAIVAILIAGVGVYANSVFATVYYRATTPNLQGALCQTVISQPAGCGSGSNQCSVTISGSTYYVSRIVDAGSCTRI